MKNISLLADQEHIVSRRRINRKQISGNSALEIFPRSATIVCAQDDATRTDDVPALSINERQTVEPLLQVSIDARPVFSAVFGAQYRAIRADRHASQRIDKPDVFKPIERVRLLKLPRNSLVLRMPDGTARAHDPTLSIRYKPN